MADLTRVLRALYTEAWLIEPEMHRRLCDMAWAHVTETAHEPGGIVAEFAKEDRKPADKSDVRMDDGVAVVEVDGVIGRKFSSFLNSSGVTSVDVLAKILTEAAEDSSVSAVVLDVDSPGGTVTGTPEASQAVAELSRVKPVVAYTGGMMASAAYWLSVPADAIFAEPSASVGSIGVYAALLDVTRNFEMNGYKTELFKAGKYKAAGVPGVPLTDEQREQIQDEVDEIAGWFKSTVTANRGDVEAETMEGQTFLGRDAVGVGLVDQIGTLADATAYARSQVAA